MSSKQVRILRDRTFQVCEQGGDMRPEPASAAGLFYCDMRHLSQWEILIDGRRLDAVSGEPVARDQAVFYLAEHTGSLDDPPEYTLVLRRRVQTGMTDALRLTNHGLNERDFQVTILFDVDFADVMELDQPPEKIGRRYERVESDGIILGYRRENFHRSTFIRAENAFITRRSLNFQVTLTSGETWSQEITLSARSHEGDGDARRDEQRRTDGAPSAESWSATVPRLDTENDHLRLTYQNSLADLTALHWEVGDTAHAAVPAAGLPRFMALFGRDALITAYQALPFMPQMCRETLRALAAHQATGYDDATDAEPGKILHELRSGELAYFKDKPVHPNYGAADTTALFLIVLDEYERWTGDADTVRELWPAALAALGWLDEHADRTPGGFIRYRTRNPEYGLVNHCWKDSDNSVVHPDGSLAALPRATCELQGYAYDARRRTARLARTIWADDSLAERLERSAAELRDAFVAAYWLPQERYYALALDGQEQPVRTLASNLGHLLWSGIVPEEHVDDVVGHLLGGPLFSGWGIRTIADGQRPYNPMGYHTGSVWPHDSAIAAAGLARYGRRREVVVLAEAGLTAAAQSNHRLPEALVGIDRSITEIPVTLPCAAWPHAWSCGAPLSYLRSLLGLEPGADGPATASVLPDEKFADVSLRGLSGRWGRADAGR
jgi:glycogen debranching enzyme